MSLWNETLDAFQLDVASHSQAPGGGSVACVTGALGLSLVLMAAEISLKPSPKTDPERLAIIEHCAQEARALVAKLRVDADDDVRAFDAFMSAWKRPRGTAVEKEERTRAIEAAAVEATFGPIAAATRMGNGIEIAGKLADLVKAAVRSDVFAGVDLLRASIHAVLRGVPANLEAIADEALRARLETAFKEAITLAEAAAQEIAAKNADR